MAKKIFGYVVLVHRDRFGNAIWRDEGWNELADEGERDMIDLYFRGTAAAAPSNGFELALFNDTPVDTDLIKDLVGEPTTNGYTRQALSRDATGWPTLALDAGDYMLTSATKTFSAVGGSWGPVTYAVLIAKGLSTPTGLTVTPQGTTGTTTWGYRVTAIAANGGETLACTEVTINNGNAVLDATNYNALAWTAVTGASQYKVYRTTAGGTPATTGVIATVDTNSYNDQGAAGNGASVPATDTSGKHIAHKALSQSRTLAAGESLDVTWKQKQK